MREGLWVVGMLLVGVSGNFAEYGDSLPLPLNQAGPGHSQKLWHGNQQIQWNPERLFRPEQSLTFQYIKAGGVDLHFLDHTHLEGFDAQELVSIGPYTVETRLGMITRCNKPLCHRVDGILGFGWLDHDRSPCLFKTLTQESRDDWNIQQPFEFSPMPRIFSMTATDHKAELQLGGYDPDAIQGDIAWIPMSKHQDYGAAVASITYGDGEDAVELLQFKGQAPGKYTQGYIGKFDSGTTCILMPNTTIGGMLEASPFETLLDLQLKGVKRSLFYTFIDENHRLVKAELEYEHCVEPTAYRMILGDPFFKKFVVIHDMQDMTKKRMGLGVRKASYDLSEEADNDYLGAFAYDTKIPDAGEASGAQEARTHQQRTRARAALREAAEAERKDLAEPQKSMREVGGLGKMSPYKISAKRVLARTKPLCLNLSPCSTN